MKLCKYFIVFIILLSIISLYASAHPGKTDSSGGHYDRNSGVYHYHHGYSAHQHTNGECPYDFDNNEKNEKNYDNDKSHDSIVSTTAQEQSILKMEPEATYKKQERISSETIILILVPIILLFPYIISIVLVFVTTIKEFIKNKFLKKQERQTIAVKNFVTNEFNTNQQLNDNNDKLLCSQKQRIPSEVAQIDGSEIFLHICSELIIQNMLPLYPSCYDFVMDECKKYIYSERENIINFNCEESEIEKFAFAFIADICFIEISFSNNLIFNGRLSHDYIGCNLYYLYKSIQQMAAKKGYISHSEATSNILTLKSLIENYRQ